MTSQEKRERARVAYHAMSNAWSLWGCEHYVHKFKSGGWYINGIGIARFPVVFKTKGAAVAQCEASVPVILARLRDEMLDVEVDDEANT